MKRCHLFAVLFVIAATCLPTAVHANSKEAKAMNFKNEAKKAVKRVILGAATGLVLSVPAVIIGIGTNYVDDYFETDHLLGTIAYKLDPSDKFNHLARSTNLGVKTGTPYVTRNLDDGGRTGSGRMEYIIGSTINGAAMGLAFSLAYTGWKIAKKQYKKHISKKLDSQMS